MGITRVPASLVDTSDHDSSDDDVPLSMLLKKSQEDDKQLTCSSNSNSGKDKSGLDDTSDDEPLIRIRKTTSLPAKKPQTNENGSGRSNGVNNKKADLCSEDSSDDDVPLVKFLKKPKDNEPQREKTKDDGSDDKPLTKKRNAPSANEPESNNKIKTTSSNGSRRNKKTAVSDLKKDDSSDDEPLIKKPKVSSKAAVESVSLPTKMSADTDSKESVDDDVSSDDEPLSEIAKRLKSHKQTKASVTPSRKASPVKTCKRKAPRKRAQRLESSSDSSDDEPLIKMKRTKGLSEEKVSTNCRKTKPKTKDLPKDTSSSDSSSDDDVPLVNLIGKQHKPTKKKTETTKKTPVSRTRKRQGQSDESSEDEPLIRLVKKSCRGATNTTTPKKRATTSKQQRKTPVLGSSSDSSDDEASIKGAKNPLVSKILRVILERCNVEEAGATGSNLSEKEAEV
ncbi:nucleolar protein dao-5-like [Centroberyx affinis]|uniref:nucleolar protein dao-5-like n=1 Tax=Centroberyx affinis TaxID=166261 RepID=UPI003A5C20E9